jgi:acyl dehydratase
MTGRCIDDYHVGETFTTRAAALDEEAIIAFARDYDPQPIHMDPEFAANEGPFGRVIASGFQTVAFSFRLYLELGHFEGTGLAGPGMDEIRWLKPVFPDAPLTSHVVVIEARPSQSKPDRGFLRLGFEVTNGAGETVLTYQSMTMLKRRSA